MDSGESMTFTSIALILLLLIIIVMFACHFLGPRTSTWMRSNREEKIGLSKNKLFHANGYMLPSGSAFLLSNSGSFKRFDIIEKEETPKATERQHSTHTTTPFWNIPQTDTNIPPQPLRPAPAPAPAPSKSVTFSKVDEIAPRNFRTDSFSNPGHHGEPTEAIGNGVNGMKFVSPHPRTSIKSYGLPEPIKLDAPPPRMPSSAIAPSGNTAIPRPLARRQISQNMFANEPRHQQLTRRNSSTNPFLCDSIENCETEENNKSHAALDSLDSSEKEFDSSNPSPNESPASTISPIRPAQSKELNPFLSQCEQNQNQYFFTNNLSESSSATRKNGDFLINGRRLTTAMSALLKPSNNAADIQKDTRGRSLSETSWAIPSNSSHIQKSPDHITPSTGDKLSNGKPNPFAGLAQKARRPHMLQKTFSEDFLFRKITINSLGSQPSAANTENGTWKFGRSLLRQDSILSLGRRNSSQVSLDSNGSVEELERAISCDSVNSDSVFMCDLDQPYTQITGQLRIGLQYDNITNEGMDLTVQVIEAKELIPPFSVESLDTFVRIYLVPDQAGAMQTEVFHDSRTPYYNESFKFWQKRERARHSLWFHLYHNGESHTLIGEAEMEIDETPRRVITWIPLSDSRKWNAQWGELMFSLSYLPTAERLTIVVVKARNLKLDLTNNDESTSTKQVQNVFVKVYLMDNEKKILKKRTSLKRRDRSLIFNESMIFNVPPTTLTTVQLRLTVYGVVNSTTILPLGHVIAGSCATGKGLRHWHQMLSSLRKPVSMWHVLRRATNQPVFTGGAKATALALRAKRNSII